MRLLSIILLVTLTAGCGSRVEPSSPAPGEPTGDLAVLHDVAERLDRLAGKADGSAELEGLPGWPLLGHWRPHAEAESTPDRDLLRDVAAGDEPPRIRALALLWLASAEQIDDLTTFDSLLDATAPAGDFPEVRVTQQVMSSYPVTWRAMSLGQVALVAAGALLGRQFETTAEYRRWRADQGDLGSSVAYWEGVLDRKTSAAARGEQLAALRQRDPELLARLLLTADDSRRAVYGIAAEEIEALVSGHYDADRLVRLLGRQERWPEFAEPVRFGRFASWVLDHWERVTGAGDRTRLLELWDAWPCPDENWVRRHLALAVARNHPDRREQILAEVLKEQPTPWMADVLRELLRDGLGRHASAIEPWFFVDDSLSADENRAAIVATLARAPQGKADLKRLVLDRRFATDSPQVIQALIDAARELGREIDCGESIVAKDTGPIMKYAKHAPREITKADEQRAARARADCLKKFARWLRTR